MSDDNVIRDDRMVVQGAEISMDFELVTCTSTLAKFLFRSFMDQ